MITETDIEEFCSNVFELRKQNNIQNDTVGYDKGSKYYRIWVSNGSSRSAYCFVEKETGDIYKSASWKAPAKGIRGNIKDSEMNGLTAYGAVYLK